MSKTANRLAGRGGGAVAAVPHKVPALTKAVAIIRYVNRTAPQGASLHEVASSLAITKSHCHNILKTLAFEGWLLHDPARGTYSLGPGLLADIDCLLARQPPPMLIHEELARLARAIGAPCVLSRVERDGSFIAIDKAEAASELLVSVPIGHRFPPDAPAQMRVRLAWMPEPERKKALASWRPRAYTKTTLVQKQAVWAELEATRRRRYAISRAEFTPGVMTLAAPIFDSFGNVQMVLQCPGLIDKVTDNERMIAGELLRSISRLNAVFGARATPADAPAAPATAKRRQPARAA